MPQTGEIVHSTESWEEAAGGGSVAAMQLLKLAGEVLFFTALGEDDLGHRAHDRLRALGIDVETVFRPTPQRRAFTHVDRAGERTITVVGERLGPHGDDALPWELIETLDALYFTAGDEAALRRARAARVLVATTRVWPLLARTHERLDAVVGSSTDPAEAYPADRLDPAPALEVRTAGASGGAFRAQGGTWERFEASPLPGPVVDAYGCGDSFAAGLTDGLGADLDVRAAVELAARCGAAALTGRGPFGGQLETG